MPRPRGTTTRTRSRGAEVNQAYRQRKLAQDPTAVPCPVCGLLLSSSGTGTHRRQHVLNGDIEVELPFQCEECGEAYETEGSLLSHVARGHKAKTRTKAPPERRDRVKFVASIAHLPYREFIEELLK